MEGTLWYLLASSRGAPTRVRLLQTLNEQPRNANELADELDLDYTTVRYHLGVFEDNNIVETTGNEYGAAYLLTDQVSDHWDTVEEILETTDTEDDG